ncbi:hypothetical protein SDRG_01865 [Saprolegnia diclina VS20]|uniref:Sfi1 spindle body domain-containing protein n=1 Tax=Saprolegnia diclina (strain VS20) TaxID=1156394 RepID=T0R364_SAPDV|nr:hypothetical protein SDRG_01865 [Saprolegnia diclina VS20]EQC40795.1 hypothetical protein SDRG_01865 [Saprolegnia diclina VS20]|eukprot:XP_008605639.1 hypothetical protein SDRG_01865 [Saprolegnia diclina VS20]
MSSSSSDEHELYLHMQATMQRRQSLSSPHPPRFKLAKTAPTRLQHALQEDTQQNLVALYYWRQKQTAAFFDQWRRITAIQLQKHKTLSAIRAESRRASNHSLLQRHQQQKKNAHSVAAESSDESSDDMRDVQRRRLIRPAPTRKPTAIADAQSERRRQSLLRARHEQTRPPTHAVEPAKSRFALLCHPFRRWRARTEATRPAREAQYALAVDHASTRLLALALVGWRRTSMTKRKSTDARRHYRHSFLTTIVHTWHHVTSIHLCGVQVQERTSQRLLAGRWRRWLARAARCQRQRVLVFFAQSQRASRQMRRVLCTFSTYAKHRARSRYKRTIAIAFVHRRTLRRVFLAWHEIAAIDLEAERQARYVVAQRAGLSRWRRYVQNVLQGRHASSIALHWYVRGRQKAVFRYWRRFLHLRRHAMYLDAKAERHAHRRLLHRIAGHWRAYLVLCDEQRVNVDMAVAHRSTVLQLAAFRAWRAVYTDVLCTRTAILHHNCAMTHTAMTHWRRRVRAILDARRREEDAAWDYDRRFLRRHLTRWRDIAHRRRYLALRSERLHARWNAERKHRILHAWRSWATTKAGYHRISSLLRSNRRRRRLDALFDAWRRCVARTQASAAQVVALRATHVRRAKAYGLYTWRLAVLGMDLAEHTRYQQGLHCFHAWQRWAARQRFLAATMKTRDAHRRNRWLQKTWRHWVALHRALRARYALLLRAYQLYRIRVLNRCFKPWGFFTLARRARRRALVHYARALLRRILGRWKTLTPVLAVANARRRRAQSQLASTLWRRCFRRWVAFVTCAVHTREQNAIADELLAYHSLWHAWRAWRFVRHRQEIQRRWPAQYATQRLRHAVASWHRHLHACVALRTQTTDARRYFLLGLQRRLWHQWWQYVQQQRARRVRTRETIEHLLWFRVAQRVVYWRREAIATAHRRSRMVLGQTKSLARQQRRTVHHWWIHSRLLHDRRQRANTAAAWRRQKQVRRPFLAWAATAARQRQLRKEVTERLGYRSSVIAGRVLQVWRAFTAKALTKRAASEHYLQWSLQRRIWQWHATATQDRELRRRLGRSVHAIVDTTQRGVWRALVSYLRWRQRKQQNLRVAADHARQQLRRRVFVRWFDVYRRQLRLRDGLQMRRARLRRRVLVAWSEVRAQKVAGREQSKRASTHRSQVILRRVLGQWCVVQQRSQLHDEALVQGLRRRHLRRSSWCQWRQYATGVRLLRLATRKWHLQSRLKCFQAWQRYTARTQRKTRNATVSTWLFLRQTRSRIVRHWRRVCERRHELARCAELAARMASTRVYRVAWRHWQHFSRDAHIVRCKLAQARASRSQRQLGACFRSWVHRSALKRVEHAMAIERADAIGLLKLEHGVDTWRRRAVMQRRYRVLLDRAAEHLRQRRLVQVLDTWVAYRYAQKERTLQVEIASSHFARTSQSTHFDAWIEYSFVCYQKQHAQAHYTRRLLTSLLARWVAALAASMVSPEELAFAHAFRRKGILRGVWRAWRCYNVHRLQERMAYLHASRQRLHAAWSSWRHVIHFTRQLRHARAYFSASSLFVHFLRWRRAIEVRQSHRRSAHRLRHLRLTHLVSRWCAYADVASDSRLLQQTAVNAAYKGALRHHFRSWRATTDRRIAHVRLVERVRSHLCSQSARTSFELWDRYTAIRRSDREATELAACHWVATKQRLGLLALALGVDAAHNRRVHAARVRVFTLQHAHRRAFLGWVGASRVVKATRVLLTNAQGHFGRKLLRQSWQQWRVHQGYLVDLRHRLYTARHVFFSSLVSRSFARLKTFALRKRQLRSLTISQLHRLQATIFGWWATYCQKRKCRRHRATRAIKLHRQSRQRHWFAHWRSVACERWMSHWLVAHAATLRSQLALLHGVRRWHLRTQRRRHFARMVSHHRRPRDLDRLRACWQAWRHRCVLRRAYDNLAQTSARNLASRSLRAWLLAYVHRAPE